MESTGESIGESPSVGNSPEWLKKELFEDLLTANVPGYRQIREFNAIGGAGAGENYATIILRIEIDVELNDGSTKLLSFMLKLPHQSELYQQMVQKNNIFDAELQMYQKVVPEFEQLYKDAGIEVKFGPQYFQIDAPCDYILLSDLRPEGFTNENRFEGLNVDHTHAVLRKIAQWHAASAVRVSLKGPYHEPIASGIFREENVHVIEEMNKALSEQFITCCTTYKGHESYIDDIRAIQKEMPNIIKSLCSVDPEEFNVLNHGDLWSNNVMFKHEYEYVTETYLIDYQMSRYGPPAQDLYYFLLSSTNFEDKLSKFDDFVQYYHYRLIDHLQLLKYSKKIPTLRDIHINLFKYGIFGFWTASSTMAGVLLDPTDTASFDNFLSDSSAGKDFKKHLFTNPRYRKQIEVILPWLHNRGALNA